MTKFFSGLAVVALLLAALLWIGFTIIPIAAYLGLVE